MLKGKRSVLTIILAGLIGLNPACDVGQTDEANKFIDEANAIIEKNKATVEKAANLFGDLLGEKMTQAEDLEEYKAENKARFDEVVSLTEESEKNFGEAAGKFEQASKVQADEKFMEYSGLKAQEFRKRAEIQKTTAGYIKAFLAEPDAPKADQLTVDNNKKTADLLKEADDLGAKADKIITDNPDVFKSS